MTSDPLRQLGDWANWLEALDREDPGDLDDVADAVQGWLAAIGVDLTPAAAIAFTTGLTCHTGAFAGIDDPFEDPIFARTVAAVHRRALLLVLDT